MVKIWANCIVYNEENFIWFSLMSVVDYVDKILVWDTGSTDKTVDIINEVKNLKGDKIEFRQYGLVDKEVFTQARQEMLEESQCDWIIILDGDEIWWRDSLKKVMEKIKNNARIGSIFVPMTIPVGDVYHLQPSSVGRYKIQGRTGHLNVRAISMKISGLHVELPYGQEGYFDGEGVPIQERSDCVFLDAPYFHATHLSRSSHHQKSKKIKYQLGDSLSESYKLPEVFFEPYPKKINNPLKKRSLLYIMQSLARWPLYILKRIK
jgi:hypothetical protein